MLEAFAISDPGLVRKTNEDCFICNDHLQLYVVADGMGGHSAGEVASRLAADAIEAFVQRSLAEADPSWLCGLDPHLSLAGNRLCTAVQLANRQVFRTAEDRDEYAGMGTTVTAAQVVGNTLCWAHVGDSRLYLRHDGEFEQITQDDSWVATLLANEPGLRKSDLAHHPMRHVLTNVIGAREQVDVQRGEFAFAPGMLLLMCSDGLHGVAGEDRVAEILAGGGTLAAMGRALVAAAIDGGGHDNITAVLVRALA